MDQADPYASVIAWLDDRMPSDLFLPAIAKAGIALLPDGKRKETLRQAANAVFAEFQDRCLALDCATATHYAEILSLSKREGRPMSVEDAQIAAIARCNGLTLATRNVADFDFLEGLELTNPWQASPWVGLERPRSTAPRSATFCRSMESQSWGADRAVEGEARAQ